MAMELVKNTLEAINQKISALSPSQFADVKIDCIECNDTGFMQVVTDKYFSVKECQCKLKKKQDQRITRIPHTYRDVDLMTMKPDLNRHPAQSLIVPRLQKNPTESYLLAGKNGSGKTHMLWSLYKHAISSNRRLVACALTELLDEYKAAIRVMDRKQEETVTVRVVAADLRQNHQPYSLFLDEIDKARPSEYAAEQLFAILDAAYAFNHQVVATTNLRIDELVDFWDRADPRYGRSIVRRLMDDRNVMEMF